MLEFLYSYEINQNIAVQKWASETGAHNFLIMVSDIIRSKHLYLYLIPLFAATNHQIYIQLLTLVTLAEYLTLTIKWLLPETRPNWWARENKVELLNGLENCEPSSGFPSGHVLITCIILFALIRYCNRAISKFSRNKRWQYIPSSIIATSVIISVSLSRMDLGVHFFHQCLSGALIASAIYLLYFNPKFNNYIRKISILRAVIYVSIMGLIVLSIYHGKKLLGVDPVWDVKTAFKWCNAPTNVNLEHTAVYGFCCAIGIMTGLAFSSPLSGQAFPLNYMKSFPSTIIVIVLQRVALDLIPRDFGPAIFYGLTFLTHSSYTFVLVSFMPKICKLCRHNITRKDLTKAD